MAGDWIKMRVGLTNSPRVRRIAECLLKSDEFRAWAEMPQESVARYAALRVTRYVTVTALLRFWGYANEHAKGETIDGVWPEDVDEVTGVPGFGDAIEAAGWVVFNRENGGLTMPNFEEHNVSATERGTSAAERQKRYRDRKKAQSQGAAVDVTRDVTMTPREEKRREEKIEDKPLMSDPVGPDDAMPTDDTLTERRKIRRPTEEDYACARKLYGVSLSVNAQAKKPNFDTWANEVRLMREQDSRTHDDIEALFNWARHDAFWGPNIQSPGKLREKWDMLVERRKRPRPGQPGMPSKFHGLNEQDHSGAQAAHEASMRRMGLEMPTFAPDDPIDF